MSIAPNYTINYRGVADYTRIYVHNWKFSNEIDMVFSSITDYPFTATCVAVFIVKFKNQKNEN